MENEEDVAMDDKPAALPRSRAEANNVSLDEIRAWMRPGWNSSDHDAAPAEKGSRFKRQVAAAMQHSWNLWGSMDLSFPEHNDRDCSRDDVDTTHSKPRQVATLTKRQPTRLCYEVLTSPRAQAWREGILSNEAGAPSPEQLVFLDAVAARCLQEQAEAKDVVHRPEPLRCVLHGVPGAGKSQTLKWLRMFLEQVCGFQRGEENLSTLQHKTPKLHTLGVYKEQPSHAPEARV